MICLPSGTILPNEVVINARWFFETDQLTAFQQIAKMMEASQHDFLERVRYGKTRKSFFESIEEFEAEAKRVEERAAEMAKPRMPRYVGRWNERRMAVFARDGHKCVKCSSTENLECDHIIPLCEGGNHEPDNLRTLCKACHREETNLLLHRRKDAYA